MKGTKKMITAIIIYIGLAVGLPLSMIWILLK